MGHFYPPGSGSSTDSEYGSGSYDLIESGSSTDPDPKPCFMFVNLSVWPEVMRQYGSLLEDYDTNSALVNDCIFTMMHHVAGDLASPHTLYIPSILQSFSRIWEQGIQICEDWVDLIGKLARHILFPEKAEV